MNRELVFVDMVSPGTGAIANAQIDAFELVWKLKGWTLAPGQDLPVDIAHTELENETKARLLEIAAERSIEVAAGATKAEVLDALKGEDS